MPIATRRTHKHFRLDSAKIKRAQKSVACKNGNRGHRACSGLRDCEHEKNRLVLQATERFIESGIEIKDVYGSLVG